MKLVELCGTWCERMRGLACSETAVQECRTNCARYRPPPSCDAEGRAAFECARTAPDVQCAYIAPTSCNNKFRRMMACARGEQITLAPDKPDMPEGWERYRSTTPKFHVPMPRNVVEKTTEGRPTFASEQGPITYSIQVYPPLTEAPTQKNLVHLAMRILGNDCSGRKLRLHGVVEQNGQMSVRYDTECRNGPDLHGLFHIAPNNFYVLTVSGPRGFKAERDAFLYGFAIE